MKVFIYSHTHWDREWYLSQNQYQFRLISTVDGIIDIIEGKNSFTTFVLDGQTSVVEDYLALRPERRTLLTRLIAEGHLVIGPWYTMPDLFIPDGESLIRNLARGARDCREYGAPFPRVGYVPDSFGHIDQLPQILQRAGIDNFIYSRGRPVKLDPNQGHRQEFRWLAPDGSSVVTWFLPRGYHGGLFLPEPNRPEALIARIREFIDAHKNSHVPGIVLIPHGIDHVWLQKEIPSILEALPALMPDVEFHHGTLEDALLAWKKELPAVLEEWRGPLRGFLRRDELHGTLSSRIDNKIANEMAEVHLENLAEPLDAIAAPFGKKALPAFLNKAWQRIFHNHAHDSICGCSQDRVHTEVNTRFREVVELSLDIADGALDHLAGRGQGRWEAGVPLLMVYAGLQGGRRLVDFVIRLATKPGAAACFRDEGGQSYPVQFDEVRRLKVKHTNGEEIYFECRGVVLLDSMAPCEVRRLIYHPKGGAPAGVNLAAGARKMGNDKTEVTVNSNGTLNILDRKSGHLTAETHYFVQEADLGGGYHFEALAGDLRRNSRGSAVKTRLVSNGPLRAVIEVKNQLVVPASYDRVKERRVGKVTLPVTTRVTLEAGDPMVRIRTTLENRAKHQRIRLVLPTGRTTTCVQTDSCFSVSETTPETWASQAPHNFHPMRNAVAISEQGHGLAFLGRGLHEYEIVPRPEGTDLEITLLRSNDFVFLCSTWETPEAQLIKTLTYDYALLPFQGDWHAASLSRVIAAYRAPAIASMYNDTPYERRHEPYATIGYYEMRGQREIPVDTNRSTWKPLNSQRDGWRREEPTVCTAVPVPEKVIPFTLSGEELVISAFKMAEEGKSARILRFWSAFRKEQEVLLTVPGARLIQADLLEQPLSTSAPQVNTLPLTIRPFEIITVRLEE